MARKAYILTFDKDDDIDYNDFHNHLIALPSVITWWHYIKSSYIIISNKSSASSFHNDIRELFPTKKRFLLMELNLKNRNGVLPLQAWEWIKKQAAKSE